MALVNLDDPISVAREQVLEQLAWDVSFGEPMAGVQVSMLWPNGVRTPTLLPLTAPLIYGGAGEYADFDGKALAGRVVLMEFASWHHWRRAAALGARASVFI